MINIATAASWPLPLNLIIFTLALTFKETVAKRPIASPGAVVQFLRALHVLGILLQWKCHGRPSTVHPIACRPARGMRRHGALGIALGEPLPRWPPLDFGLTLLGHGWHQGLLAPASAGLIKQNFHATGIGSHVAGAAFELPAPLQIIAEGICLLPGRGDGMNVVLIRPGLDGMDGVLCAS